MIRCRLCNFRSTVTDRWMRFVGHLRASHPGLRGGEAAVEIADELE